MADEPNAAAPQDPPVQKADLPDLSGAATAATAPTPNLDLIKDIEVTLTVELGRTQMLIEEVLQLTPGKVVELEKLAGEALDILINGRLMARGEVVVVDDRFGIRITSVMDPRARVAALGSAEEPAKKA